MFSAMYRMITNNYLCRDAFQDRLPVEYLEDASYLDVLLRTRDCLHLGHTLETHPLAGSLKPDRMPFKTVILSERRPDAEYGCMQEILIENALDVCRKLTGERGVPAWSEKLRQDFREVDLSIMEQTVARLPIQ